MKTIKYLACILIPMSSYGQFVVTYVKGNVTYENHLVRLRDKITGTEKITSADKSAVVGMIHPELGKVFVTFDSSRPAKKEESGKSELYELVVNDFFRKYTSRKILTTRDADFDLFYFITDTTGNADNKMLLIEGQSLPVRSVIYRVEKGDQFYLCYNGRQHCFLMRRSGDMVTVLTKDGNRGNNSSNVVLPCTFQRRFTSEGKTVIQDFPVQVSLCIKSAEAVKMVIASFYDNLATLYKGDMQLLRNDLYDHLFYFYGKVYRKEIDRLITEVGSAE